MTRRSHASAASILLTFSLLGKMASAAPPATGGGVKPPPQVSPANRIPQKPPAQKSPPAKSAVAGIGAVKKVDNASIRKSPPAKFAAPVSRLFPPASITLTTLPNGVRSVVEQTRGTDLVSVQIWVRAGSRFESEANNGVANLIERLALRGSKNYPRSERSGGPEEALGALGCQVGSLTSRDSTFYSVTAAAGYLPSVLRVLADATLQTDLSDRAVEEAKLDVEGEVMMRANDPVLAVNDLAYRAAFTRHPYRRPARGTSSSIAALTGGPVRLYHSNHYVGGNISIIIVGDVPPLWAHKLVATHFARASAKRPPSVAISAETSPTAYKAMTRSGTTPFGAMAVAFRAPGINQPKDVVAMDVLLSHWKEGDQAALRRVLGAVKASGGRGGDAPGDDKPDAGGGGKEEEGPRETAPRTPLAQAFDVDFLTQRDPGLMIISLLQPRSRDDALKAILDEVGHVQKNGLTAAEIAEAKRLLTQQYVEQSETVSGQAGALGFYEMISNYQFGARYLDYVAQVTPADIKRVANRYCSTTVYVRAIIEPAPRMPPNRTPDPGGDTLTASIAGDSMSPQGMQRLVR